MGGVPELGRLVSILIPTYNRSHLVGRAVRSALSQTHAALEIIVTDNSEDDRSRRVIEGIGSEKVLYLKNESNIGPILNWRRALDNAKGEFAIILPDDDYLINPFYIEEAVALADKTKCGLIITNCLFGKNDKISCSYLKLEESTNGRHFLYNFWQGQYTIPTIANLFKVELARKFENFSNNEILYSDIELWLKLMSITNVAYYKIPSVYYSFHEQNNIVTSMNSKQLVSNSIFIRNVSNTIYDSCGNELSVKIRANLVLGYLKLLRSVYGRKALSFLFINDILNVNDLERMKFYNFAFFKVVGVKLRNRLAKIKKSLLEDAKRNHC